MTKTADAYIASVLDQMPNDTPLRDQIAMELRGHVAERQEQGVEMDDILDQLGDPKLLAESYLSAVPLEAASAGERLAAKFIDAFMSLLVLVPLMYLCTRVAPGIPLVTVVLLVGLGGGCVLLGIYTTIAESSSDQTIGKKWMGIRVVRETGARISYGEALVRQLPLVFQVIWVDALFALFTDRSQRAFELLSRTRVVRVAPREISAPASR